MIKKKRVISIVISALVLCLALISTSQAAPPEWANAGAKPNWEITGAVWVDYAPNPRFAIYDAGTTGDNSDDLVLDKETGLVWTRNANIFASIGSGNDETQTWDFAQGLLRNSIKLGNRLGWRLPTIEELSSLVDPSQVGPALPSGHPFINVQNENYWSSTSFSIPFSNNAWRVYMYNGIVQGDLKSEEHHVWPVRSGFGYDGVGP